MTENLQTLAGLLGLVALALGVAVLGLVLITRRATDGGAAGTLASIVSLAPVLAFAMSATAMAGSLYFSEVAHYAPCNLCWYQRIAMYSLAVITFVAAIRRDRGVAPYALTLSLIGLSISTYHYLLEWNPQWESNVCSLTVPCTTVWFRTFGFMTLSFMAGCAFLATAALMMATMMQKER